MLENRLHIQNGKQFKVSSLKLQHYDECKPQSYGNYSKFNVRTVLSYKHLECAGVDIAQELCRRAQNPSETDSGIPTVTAGVKSHNYFC